MNTIFYIKIVQILGYRYLFFGCSKKKDELINLWKKISSNIDFIIENFFGKIYFDVQVKVYPEYFFLGAINLERGIIVLGQPSRSPRFYGGILLHELIHFVLKNKGLNRMVEEVICFSFERMFIMEYDGINLEGFNYEKNTDEFHKQAIIYSKKFQKDFIGFYKDKNLIGLLNFFNENIKDKEKEMKIENNLIDYLLQSKC